MGYETLRYEVAATGVATIALDQPETRNALSDRMLDELLAALDRRTRRRRGACVVLTSTHETVFSSGGDLTGFAADVPLVLKHAATERFPRLFQLIGELGKPTICAANGHVLAGALGLALACDLIVAKEGATFGTPEINIGIFPFMIMALIYRNVGRKKTNELLLLGERIDAHEAERLGIVNKVVPAAEFDAAVDDVGDEARLEVAAPHAARQGRDVPPAGPAVRRGARAAAPQPHARVCDGGHARGREGVLREARAALERAVTPVGRRDRSSCVALATGLLIGPSSCVCVRRPGTPRCRSSRT